MSNSTLHIAHDSQRHHIDVFAGPDRLLWRYVYVPVVPANEAPRPYIHPLHSLAGDLLSNFRPNDHPWHHGLNLTLTSADGINFWGGPSYRTVDGYCWRDDQGSQLHRSWVHLEPENMEHEVDWVDPRSGRLLFRESRRLATSLVPDGWSLRWTSALLNTAGHDVSLGNYHSQGGLSGSHYTGLQFRGARALLDDHGDSSIGITAEGDLAGEKAVHGAAGRWMEWCCQSDTSLRRTRIRFESLGGPAYWFVRRNNPLAAFSFHREEPHVVRAGTKLILDHLLVFTNL